MSRYLIRDLLEALEAGDGLHCSAATAIVSLTKELAESQRRAGSTFGSRILEAVADQVLEREPKVSGHQLQKECVATVVNVQIRSGETYQNRGGMESKVPASVTVDVRLTVSDPAAAYTADAGDTREDIR